MDKSAKRMLLVDDETLIVRVLRRSLERDGYEVFEASSATEALEVFRTQQPFHALLCDVYLGDGSGWKVAEEIYLMQPSIRVLMLSGAMSFGVTPASLEYAMLYKPFNHKDLREAIDALWRRPE